MIKSMTTLPIEQIKPYENNPRLNDDAVEAVRKSMEQCGYIAPIVVDEYHVVLAGHTRLKALKQMGAKHADVLVVQGLSDVRKQKYRLLDNKTNELALWDFDKLAEELEGLDFDDLELDWWKDMPELDIEDDEPVEHEEVALHESISVVIECENDRQAEEIFDELTEAGYKCRISTL